MTATVAKNESGFGGRLRRWLRARRERSGLALASPRVFEEAARDLRVSPADLSTATVRNADAGRLMPERLAATGVDSEYVRAAEPGVWRDLERVCCQCTSGKQCAADLAAGDHETGQRTYCLNAGTIDALAVGQRRGRE